MSPNPRLSPYPSSSHQNPFTGVKLPLAPPPDPFSTSFTESTVSAVSSYIEEKPYPHLSRYDSVYAAAVFEMDGLVVTTLQDTIAYPVYGKREIRLRKGAHFGLEDPLFHPQPFNPVVGHLALIPLPSTNPSHPHAIAWAEPTPEQFQLLQIFDSDQPSTALGVYDSSFVNKLLAAVGRLVGHANTLRRQLPERFADFNGDPYLTRYIHELKWLASRLRSPSLRDRAFHSVKLFQRTYLELVARLHWVAYYSHEIQRVPLQPKKAIGGVVGAIVGNNEDAFLLFNLGIPYWLIRPQMEVITSTIVNKLIKPSSSEDVLKARTHGFTLSMEDPAPSSSAIFTGFLSVKSLDQYKAMATSLRRMASTHLYEPSPSQAPIASTLSTSRNPSSGTVRQEKSYSQPRRQKKGKSVNSSKETKASKDMPPEGSRNKFAVVTSPIMPLPLRNWQLAADEVGKTFNPNEHDHPLGYFLPDPKMIANAGLSSERTITRNKWIANWLRLRDVLIFRLTSELVSDLTPVKWKSILGLGYFSYKSNQASKGKAAIEKALEDTLGEMKNNIKIDRLGDLPVRWDGKDLDVDTADVAVLRRVL